MTNTEGSERYNVAVFEDGRREPWAKESPACLEIGIAVLGGLDYRAPRTEKQCTLPRKSPLDQIDGCPGLGGKGECRV